jgi:predicted  nucleic acid-binding Zn-ribbon protein
MTVEHTVITCINCGKDLSDLPNALNERIACPDCGSSNRKTFVTIEEKLHISAAVGSKVKDSTGFVKQESDTKQSHSDKTGRPVTITKDVDRTNPDFTTFHHKVEELDEHGILSKTIHEHTDKKPAKHRLSKKE